MEIAELAGYYDEEELMKALIVSMLLNTGQLNNIDHAVSLIDDIVNSGMIRNISNLMQSSLNEYVNNLND